MTFDGTPLRDPGDVRAVVAGRRPGAAVTAAVIRAGTLRAVAMILGERPSGKR